MRKGGLSRVIRRYYRMICEKIGQEGPKVRRIAGLRMAKRGRKPKPTALKLLEGTRPDRVNLDEPRAIQGDPTPPEGMGDAERKVWEWIVPLLRENGLFSMTDVVAVESYCLATVRKAKADRELKQGMVVMSAAGTLKPSPYIAIAREAQQTMDRFHADFGCSPSARSRLRTSGASKPKDTLELFLEQNG